MHTSNWWVYWSISIWVQFYPLLFSFSLSNCTRPQDRRAKVEPASCILNGQWWCMMHPPQERGVLLARVEWLSEISFCSSCCCSWCWCWCCYWWRNLLNSPLSSPLVMTTHQSLLFLFFLFLLLLLFFSSSLFHSFTPSLLLYFSSTLPALVHHLYWASVNSFSSQWFESTLYTLQSTGAVAKVVYSFSMCDQTGDWVTNGFSSHLMSVCLFDLWKLVLQLAMSSSKFTQSLGQCSLSHTFASVSSCSLSPLLLPSLFLLSSGSFTRSFNGISGEFH